MTLVPTGGGLALSIGLCYVHLIDPEPHGNETAGFLKFPVGLEF